MYYLKNLNPDFPALLQDVQKIYGLTGQPHKLRGGVRPHAMPACIGRTDIRLVP